MKLRYVYLVEDGIDYEGYETVLVYLDEASAVQAAEAFAGTDSVRVAKWDLDTQAWSQIYYRGIDR